MAAGEMDVDRAVELDARLAPCARSPRRGPWCRRRRSGSPCCRCRRRGRRGSRSPWSSSPSASIAASASRDLVVRHAGDQQVLPDGEADIAVAAARARSRRGRASASAVSLPTGSTTPIQLQPGLLLRMHADMGGAVEDRPRRDGLGGHAHELAAELLLDRGEELLEAPGVEHIFQPRLVAVGAVAVLDEDAHDGVGDLASPRPASRRRRCRARNRGGR